MSVPLAYFELPQLVVKIVFLQQLTNCRMARVPDHPVALDVLKSIDRGSTGKVTELAEVSSGEVTEPAEVSFGKVIDPSSILVHAALFVED